MAMPHAIARYLRGRVLSRLRPALLELDPDYRLRSWAGELEQYGIGSLETGLDARDLLPSLHGLQPGEDNALAFVEAPSGGSMDLTLLPSADGFELLITDSSDERDRQLEIQQQANEISLLHQRQSKLLEALEQADRVKGRFIAAMSHEFRTPLTAIKGQVALQREPDADPAGGLDVIDVNATHLLSLIDNVLDQSKIESGQLELLPETTDMPALLRDLRTMFEPMARRRGIALVVELGDCPRLLRLDAPRLRQILVNLLGNAFKFTKQGQVGLTLSWNDGRLSGAVRDTGPGIPEQARRRIFQAFHQERGSGSREGVGLGLAISSQLASLMGGGLSVDSRLGEGSEFRFDMLAPLGESVAECSPADIQVLVADDSEDLRILLLHQLGREGFPVEGVEDGDSVLAAVRRQPPDVALLDLYLGDTDGAELAGRLRESGYRGAILMLSGASSDEERRRALAAGCDDFMVKPAQAQALRRRVMELASRA